MRTFEKLMLTALTLVLVYLVLSNYQGANAILGTSGRQLSGIFKTLQARD